MHEVLNNKGVGHTFIFLGDNELANSLADEGNRGIRFKLNGLSIGHTVISRIIGAGNPGEKIKLRIFSPLILLPFKEMQPAIKVHSSRRWEMTLRSASENFAGTSNNNAKPSQSSQRSKHATMERYHTHSLGIKHNIFSTLHIRIITLRFPELLCLTRSHVKFFALPFELILRFPELLCLTRSHVKYFALPFELILRIYRQSFIAKSHPATPYLNYRIRICHGIHQKNFSTSKSVILLKPKKPAIFVIDKFPFTQNEPIETVKLWACFCSHHPLKSSKIEIKSKEGNYWKSATKAFSLSDLFFRIFIGIVDWTTINKTNHLQFNSRKAQLSEHTVSRHHSIKSLLALKSGSIDQKNILQLYRETFWNKIDIISRQIGISVDHRRILIIKTVMMPQTQNNSGDCVLSIWSVSINSQLIADRYIVTTISMIIPHITYKYTTLYIGNYINMITLKNINLSLATVSHIKVRYTFNTFYLRTPISYQTLGIIGQRQKIFLPLISTHVTFAQFPLTLCTPSTIVCLFLPHRMNASMLGRSQLKLPVVYSYKRSSISKINERSKLITPKNFPPFYKKTGGANSLRGRTNRTYKTVICKHHVTKLTYTPTLNFVTLSINKNRWNPHTTVPPTHRNIRCRGQKLFNPHLHYS